MRREQDLFGYIRDDKGERLGINPNAPSPAGFAFLGPLIGSLIRPIGGILSDKFGGALVTQVPGALSAMPAPAAVASA